jgi:hypothetical protein
MTTPSSVLPLPRPVLTAIAGFAAAVLLAALLYTIFEVEKHRSRDSSLERTAGRLLPSLKLTGAGYDAEPTFYRMYQRYVYDERAALVKKVARDLPKGQWAQIIILETRSAPPQTVLLNLPHRSPVPVNTGSTETALQKHQSAFATTQLQGATLRVYLTPITPPSVFDQQDVSAILEVIEKQ